MYPYYKEDIDKGVITREFAQELIDCIWVKMNDLNKCRDEESAKGFAGYSLFQNLIVGGQNKYGSLWKMQENTTSSDVLNRRNPVRQTAGMMQRSLICAVRLNLFLQMVWTRVYRLAFRLAMLPR